MTTHFLKFPVDNFDQTASFRFSFGLSFNKGETTRRGYLFKDDGINGDGTIYVMQSGAMIKSSYSAEDVAERNRLNASEPVKQGDQVEIDGVWYTVGKLGDYSDAGKLIKNENQP